MPDEKPDAYQPPELFDYKQPDLSSSTSEAAEEAFDARQLASEQKEKEKESEEEDSFSPRQDNSLQSRQQMDVSAQMNQKKAADIVKNKKKEEVMEAAGAAATKIPVAGWFIKIAAFLIKGIKFVFGEKIASYLAVFIIFSAILFPLNLLVFLGVILSICLTIVFAPLLWPKIKPLIEGATKITPTKK